MNPPELIIEGDEAWSPEEWEVEQVRLAKRRAEKRAYTARPDVKERTKAWDRAHRANRREYNRVWMARYRSMSSDKRPRLVGSLHDLACTGPTRATGCVCNKIRMYTKPR